MKRQLFVCAALSLGLAVSAWAIDRPGLISGGEYVNSTLGSAMQPAPAAGGHSSVYQVGKWPTYTAELEPGKGRDTVLGNCSMCHSVTYITMQPPLPAATWKGEVEKMIKTFGAPIQEAQAAEIIQYLQTHYTPETRKQ